MRRGATFWTWCYTHGGHRVLLQAWERRGEAEGLDSPSLHRPRGEFALLVPVTTSSGELGVVVSEGDSSSRRAVRIPITLGGTALPGF